MEAAGHSEAPVERSEVANGGASGHGEEEEEEEGEVGVVGDNGDAEMAVADGEAVEDGGGGDVQEGRQAAAGGVFRIEIQGLPKFFGMGQAKKLLNNKLKLKPHKLKPGGPKSRFMFVNFR